MEAQWCRLASSTSHRALAFALAVLGALMLGVAFAPPARASFYDVVFCAAGNGSGDPTLGARPGFFDFDTNCDWTASYPAGGNTNEYLRLNENTNGAAGNNDEASMSWYTPPWVSIVAGGGYTREPNSFNQGWRARFWAEDWGGGVHNIMLQGTGIGGTGSEPFITKNTTSIFASHLWPYGGWDDFKRFVFGLWCVRPDGCDRSNFNAVDANTITLVANDKKTPEVGFVDGATVRGEWVRGYQVLAWNEHDEGAGLRFSRLKIDNATRGDGTIDYQANNGCRIGHRDGNREFGKSLQPCTPGPYLRYYGLETGGVSDGQHELAICLQDYSQYLHNEDTCDRRTVRFDNHAPSAPASLAVTSANPARYLPNFAVGWSLPANTGSPITKIHYQVVNAKGEGVSSAQTVSGTNLKALSGIAGPSAPGDYRLKLWLEDQVGYSGPASTAQIPHDTVPPAAPQNLHVIAPSLAHRVPKFDLRWDNVVDAGSPIDTAHYQVIDASGNVIVPARTTTGEGVQEIHDIETPAAEGSYRVRVWVSDQEGNVGAVSTVPVPRDTTPPAAPQDVSVTAPGQSRAAQGFDVRWRDIRDDGAPVDAAHYQVLDSNGGIVVDTQEVPGQYVEAITDLSTPHDNGNYTLRLWLSDGEGNVGAPVSLPLTYRCVRADTNAGSSLAAGLGADAAHSEVVREGRGSTLRGALRAASGAPVGLAPVCIYSRIVTDSGRDFLGLAMTGRDGSYQFPVAPGASREITAVHRRDHREVADRATLQTIVHPTFKARRRVLYNKGYAHFYGQIPGPHNNRVVIVLQARVGKGWSAFRRYRTRNDGRFNLAYKFRRTFRRTRYVMRAQVRQTVGYPYLQGNSRRLKLLVLPHRPRCKGKSKAARRHCKRRRGRGTRHAKHSGHSRR